MKNGFELEVAAVIVSVLELEVAAEDIDPTEALFFDGLGLDSIDALELALEFSERYGLEIRTDYEENEEVLANLRTLARHIERNRTN